MCLDRAMKEVNALKEAGLQMEKRNQLLLLIKKLLVASLRFGSKKPIN